MRLRFVTLLPVLVTLIGLIVGCSKNPPAAEKTGPTTAATQAADAKNTDVGAFLYPPAAYPGYQAVFTRVEPIVIPNALVQYEERLIVSAEVDGTIEVFGTPVTPEEAAKLPADQIVYHPRDLAKAAPLKRIVESDEVKIGQILGYMDDQQILARKDGAAKIRVAAEYAQKSAEVGAKAAEEKLDQAKKTAAGGVGSKTEVLDAQLTYQRFVENLAQAQQTIAKADQDFAESSVILEKLKIKSRVNGTIRSMPLRAGYYAKGGEKIMEIEATDRVRIEGQLDVQYAGMVRRGMTVTVEPAVPSAPLASHTGHRQAVTGVAVTGHPDGALVVSVGADGGALVWDPNLGKKANKPTVPHNLPHPVGVRSVAAAPPAAKAMLVVTGADDGKVRVWDVTNRDKLPTAPKVVPDDAHTSAVQAVAISPDGKFFATAAGRDVFVWELASAKKLYALPVEHRDAVTAVSFTPQNTLVTTSKDGSVKVWKLGTEKAAVVRTLDHRAGAVDVLGVSPDGGRVLFDQDKGRLDLVDLATGQTVGQLQNVSSAGSFATLALFGQQDTPFGAAADALPPYGVVTAGGDGDLKGTIQYWHAPRTGGRGAEVARLITPGRSPVTAAAGSPVRGEQFLVVGTAAGGVHLWKPPTEARKTRTGRITLVDHTDARYVTVRVEMDNKELGLIDHSAATIIVPPAP